MYRIYDRSIIILSHMLDSPLVIHRSLIRTNDYENRVSLPRSNPDVCDAEEAIQRLKWIDVDLCTELLPQCIVMLTWAAQQKVVNIHDK